MVAANAGGAFSPFGDITTLMVWQAGLVRFEEFFALFLPSLVNWLVTAGILGFAIGKGQPEPVEDEANLQHGAWVVVALFLVTIAMAVMSHNYLHLPPVIGMMTGLGLLKLFGYYLQLQGPAPGAEGTAKSMPRWTSTSATRAARTNSSSSTIFTTICGVPSGTR